MAAIEKYVRVSVVKDGVEFIAGLELRNRDFFPTLSSTLRAAMTECLAGQRISHDQWVTLADQVKDCLATVWPGRAWFLEVGVDNEWVQVYQPYGLPRGTE
jgi:hypothetical protein